MDSKSIRIQKVAVLFAVISLVFSSFYLLPAFSDEGRAVSFDDKLAQPKAEETGPQAAEQAPKESAKRRLFDFSVEYMYSALGQQTFDVINDDNGALISRLKYPYRGNLMIFNAEVYVLPRLSVGGRLSNSSVLQLDDSNSTDTDWDSNTGSAEVETESNSKSKTEVTFFDVNMYGRLLDLAKGTGAAIFGKKLSDLFLIGQKSKLTFDIFGGYQYQKGRYSSYNLHTTVDNYAVVDVNTEGEDSFYKTTYRGPRLGARGEYVYDRFSARISGAYSWLNTKAEGYWSLREYPFYQHGIRNNGWGVDLKAEVECRIIQNLSVGCGYNYMIRRQHAMRESGHEEGKPDYTDSDIIRNANNSLYGPTCFLKFIW